MIARHTIERAAAMPSSIAAGACERELSVLVGRRGQPVQAQEVSDGPARAAATVEGRARRTAVPVDGALLRRQAIRAGTSDRTRRFDEAEEALRWSAQTDGDSR